MSGSDLTPEFVTAPERTIVGTARSYTMDTRHEIGAQWQSFFDVGYDLPEAVPGKMFGASFSVDGKGGFRYAVAVEVTQLPETLPKEFCSVTLSAGLYAVVRRFGPISGLPQVFDQIFTDWLPGSDYAIRQGAVFEIYPEDERNGPEGTAYEIWVPIRAKT